MPRDLRNDLPRLRRAMDGAPSIFNQRPWELRLAAADRVELCTAANESLGGWTRTASGRTRTCGGPHLGHFFDFA
jgi:hypothetical protein